MPRSRVKRTLLTTLALVLAVVWAFPVYWMLNSAFLPNVVLQSATPTFLPFGGSLDNLRAVATEPSFGSALTISLVVTLTTVVAAIMIAGVLGSALSQSFWVLIAFRFVLGFGVRGDYPVSAVMVSEYANRKDRGKLVGMVVGTQALGLIVAPLIALVGSWFPAGAGLAIGLASAGQALGQGSVPFATAFLIEGLGWRGAFLAHGSLTEPGRSMALEVTCPGPEAALALVGAARRLGIPAKAREVRNVDRVVIRDGDAIGALLTRLGAHESLMAWEERRMRREVRASANRLANFDDANLRRSARAAVAAGARVERALEILGEEIPDHLRQAGHLRLEHKQASLEELGQLHEPVLTKDAIAGRIRRLLAMADKRAEDLGIPDTEASLTPEMLAEDV